MDSRMKKESMKDMKTETNTVDLDIKSMDMKEIEEAVFGLGGKRFRAKQLFDWMHAKQVRSYDEMKNLPGPLLQKLESEYPLTSLEEVSKQTDDTDKTTKYLFRLGDGQLVETVLMKYKYGYSICISSQVGCKMGCTFCASTIGGLVRQLQPSEMLDQIYAIEYDLNIKVHSIVVMGTGEPLDNYDNLVRFIRLLSHERGRNLSRRNITVSTCGIIEKIEAIGEDIPQINLAISLHAPFQNKRREVMPVAAKYPLDELIKACREHVAKTGRRITFEYSLIKGVNDSAEYAKALAELLEGMLCHVNLIPVNPVDERDYTASDTGHVAAFKKMLEKGHINTTIRRSLGAEYRCRLWSITE